MNDPGHYIGRTVILGGAVLKTAYVHDKAVVEVLHLPLNESQRPLPALRESQGLFVAVANTGSAAARLASGAIVTIIGEVVQADRPGAAIATGTAPRLHVKYVHVWESTFVGNDRLSALLHRRYVDTSVEQQYRGCTIRMGPSFTDAGTLACGYTVFDESGKVLFDGYLHGPFATAERAKRGALREAKERIDHMIRPNRL